MGEYHNRQKNLKSVWIAAKLGFYFHARRFVDRNNVGCTVRSLLVIFTAIKEIESPVSIAATKKSGANQCEIQICIFVYMLCF